MAESGKKGRVRGSEADLAQCGALALPPPFLFCGCWCNFFFQRPLNVTNKDAPCITYLPTLAGVFLTSAINFCSFARFSLFFTLPQCTAAHANTLKAFRRKSLKKKVALVGCGIAPTKQTKVPILQSQVQVQVCTSSFLKRVVFASPSSARRFSQDKTDKKPKRRASSVSVDNSHCRLL